MRPLLFEISDDRLTAIPNVDSFNANDLRSAAPQATQRLNQDCERARQSTCRRRSCQDVTIAAVSGVMIAFTVVLMLVMERAAGLSRRLR